MRCPSSAISRAIPVSQDKGLKTVLSPQDAIKDTPYSTSITVRDDGTAVFFRTVSEQVRFADYSRNRMRLVRKANSAILW
jgi:hypothetical protein